eukprot:CAMPEP_0182829788 /NCGR_PEP_ID=MMETSP0006_2-20121128/18226_1 /TAXON_ID=97485 /ORGANISM="Prymnesium parvum, Strain Texoma1" /LENGTH=235 /DNA_ID=CAMNT_0024957307 /DNA_START=219 /DNA_END=923 /DNA_ORIENTATION=+
MPPSSRNLFDVLEEVNGGEHPEAQDVFEELFVKVFLHFDEYHLSSPYNKSSRDEDLRKARVRVRFKWLHHSYDRSGELIMNYNPPTPERALQDMAASGVAVVMQDTSYERSSSMCSSSPFLWYSSLDRASVGSSIIRRKHVFLGHGATPAQSRTSTLEEKMNAGFHNMQTSYDVLLDEVRALRQLVERHLSDTADDNTMQVGNVQRRESRAPCSSCADVPIQVENEEVSPAESSQ